MGSSSERSDSGSTRAPSIATRERRLSYRYTVPRWPDPNTDEGGFALPLPRLRVDRLAHRADEPLDGFVRVRDVEVETPAQAVTGDVAEGSPEEVSVPTLGQRAGEEPVEVRRELGRGGREDELATPVEDEDRLGESDRRSARRERLAPRPAACRPRRRRRSRSLPPAGRLARRRSATQRRLRLPPRARAVQGERSGLSARLTEVNTSGDAVSGPPFRPRRLSTC